VSLQVATPILNLRVDDETKARWQAAADLAGYRLSEWIRSCCDARADARAAATAEPEKRGGYQPRASGPPPTVPPPKPGGRASVCEHRIPAGSFCKACDR
jgi:hypothetical protein